MRDGEWFVRACKLSVRVWPVSPQASRGRRVRLRERLRSLEQRVQTEGRRLDLDAGPEENRAAALRRLERLRGERDRVARVLAQPSFHRALEATQLPVTLEEVLRFATVAALGTAIVGVIALIGATWAGVPAFLVVSLVALAVAGPPAAYAGVASYPEALAKRRRVQSLGGAPEAVNYMAMSMRLVPALDRAVEFAAHHTEEPLATRLRSVLWSVYLRSPPGVEAAFLRFAQDWGEWQEDLKRAFFAIGGAALERTEAGLERALEKARFIAYEGTKARIQEYAASLRGPTTVLFALGVLLPLVLGAMLPLLSLGGIGAAVPATGRPAASSDSGVPVVLAMDVLFPLGAFAYAYRILGNRPGTGGSGESPPALRSGNLVVSAALVVVALAGLALAPTPAVVLASLWVLAAAGVVMLLPGLRAWQRRRRSAARLEAEFPDALFLLGSRVSEGLPVERALATAAEATRGSEAAGLFERIVGRLQTSREGLEGVLFGSSGVLHDVPSRTVRAAFRMVAEVSRKDSSTAGKAIVETSAYMRDLRDVDREIRQDLGSVVDAMQSTAILFAPIVLGVTCALYGLLARSFSELVTLGLTPAAFLGVVGVYLVLAVAVITYFSVGVARGRDPGEVRAQLVRAWPASLAVFTVAFLVAQAGLA